MSSYIKVVYNKPYKKLEDLLNESSFGHKIENIISPKEDMYILILEEDSGMDDIICSNCEYPIGEDSFKEIEYFHSRRDPSLEKFVIKCTNCGCDHIINTTSRTLLSKYIKDKYENNIKIDW